MKKSEIVDLIIEAIADAKDEIIEAMNENFEDLVDNLESETDSNPETD